MTIICCSVNLYEVITVVMTGGVGKNGSTVAVSLEELCTRDHVAFLHYRNEKRGGCVN